MTPYGKSAQWRWDRARRLAAEAGAGGTLAFGEDDDKTTRQLAAYAHADSVERRPDGELLKRFPVIRRAALLFLDSSPSSWRWTLEALALTELTDEEVAKETRLPAALVKMFYDCFFDVRSEEDKEGYITYMHTLLKSFTTLDMPHLGWKHIAARGGAARFRRLVLHRDQATKSDLKWLMNDAEYFKALMVWGRAWSTLNEGGTPSPDRLAAEQFVAGHAVEGGKTPGGEGMEQLGEGVSSLLGHMGDISGISMDEREAAGLGAEE